MGTNHKENMLHLFQFQDRLNFNLKSSFSWGKCTKLSRYKIDDKADKRGITLNNCLFTYEGDLFSYVDYRRTCTV